jgi:hypothetical protein
VLFLCDTAVPLLLLALPSAAITALTTLVNYCIILKPTLYCERLLLLAAAYTVQLAIRHTADVSADVSRGDTPLQGATVAVQVPQGYALTSAPRQLTLYSGGTKCDAPLVLHARKDVLPESLQCEATVLHTGTLL